MSALRALHVACDAFACLLADDAARCCLVCLKLKHLSESSCHFILCTFFTLAADTGWAVRGRGTSVKVQVALVATSCHTKKDDEEEETDEERKQLLLLQPKQTLATHSSGRLQVAARAACRFLSQQLQQL